ncbi:zinc protease [Pontibacillus halophilus JSM 076056 = DSM 19796]|uniref:Zinc protease n=1 Tax=Pontibacillus halophilus JSM 076056 = DSM 19796 TaxID=1385510 RepID=A0A0A5GPM6_9BACI|nr:pitrilysin family protein [Pontibacillus halophilus]KGX93110.1 zinc protease [Pontibacillus halophilus JSM 076056 = DSM 19796]
MPSIQEKKVDGDGYRLHIIPTNKYKTNTIVLKFRAPLERETITKRALLPYVLQQATENHPSARSFRTALDDLYGTVLSVDASKKGENHIITFRMELANDAFLRSDEDLLKQGLELLHEVVFKPKMEGGSLDPTILEREKQTLIQKIKSILDDKMSYANMRLMDEMCEEEAYRFHVHGYEEDLEEIDGENLYSYYQTLLSQDELDIFIQGAMDESRVEELAKEYFTRNYDPSRSIETTVKDAPSTPKEVVERQNIQQGKLHLGYRTGIRFQDDDYYALQIFNGLFGGFPSSKLFMNVREKHSLAYYAASRFESHKGLLLVFSGIAPEDYDQAREIIEEQMNAMKNGDFTDEAISETKKQVTNQLLETMDNPYGLTEILYHQVLSGKETTPDEMLQGVNQVEREDLLRVAKAIELDTVYFLTKDEEGGQS